MRSVVLYTRRGCHLCDEARSAILSVRAREPFAYDEVDIDTDDDLVRDYGIRVPVVTGRTVVDVVPMHPPQHP